MLRPEVAADASANVINQLHASVLRPEVGADASALLQRLCKHLVLADVVVSHRTTSKLHRFLEMSSRYFWHRVIVIILHAHKHTHTRQNYTLLKKEDAMDRSRWRKLIKDIHTYKTQMPSSILKKVHVKGI